MKPNEQSLWLCILLVGCTEFPTQRDSLGGRLIPDSGNPGTAGGSATCNRGTGGQDARSSTQFITSAPVPADFGGVLGAERLCNLAAEGAGLRPVFSAWLAENSQWPGVRLLDAALDDGPDEFAPVGDDCPFCVRAVRFSDEHGRAVDAGVSHWLGFTAACVAGDSCQQWSSTSGVGLIGLLASTSLEDTELSEARSCAERHRLLCRTSDRRGPVDGGVPLGTRVAFVSRQAVPGNLGGLSGADQLCNDFAHDGGFQGAFRAFLGTGATEATSRFSNSGPWSLPSGSKVFLNPATLATTPRAGLSEDEHREPVNAGERIWTGSAPWKRSTGQHCSGWTSNSGDGTVGSTGSVDHRWVDDGAQSCALSAHLLCLEEPH